MHAMDAEMHAQAAAWAHVAPPIVVAPPDPRQADDVMAHENGGPPAPPTGTIQEGMAGIAGAMGGAIASQVTSLYDQGIQHMAERAGRVARRQASRLAAPWLRAPMPRDLVQPLLGDGAAAAEGMFAGEAAGAGAMAAEAGMGAAAAAAGTIGAALLPAAAAGLATAAVVAAGDQILHVAGDLFRNQNNTTIPPHVAPAHLAVNGHIPGAPEAFRPPPRIGGSSTQPVPIHPMNGTNSTIRSHHSDEPPGSAGSAGSARTLMYVPTFPQPAGGPPAVAPGAGKSMPIRLRAKKDTGILKKKAKAPVIIPVVPDEPNAKPVLPIGRVSIRKPKPETYENEGKRRRTGNYVPQARQKVSIRKVKAPTYENQGKRRRIGEPPALPEPTQRVSIRKPKRVVDPEKVGKRQKTTHTPAPRAPPKVVIVPHESQQPRVMNKKPVLPVRARDIGPIATVVR
jgi:hypothetical protein